MFRVVDEEELNDYTKTIRKQERQKVIAELEEWVEKASNNMKGEKQ